MMRVARAVRPAATPGSARPSPWEGAPATSQPAAMSGGLSPRSVQRHTSQGRALPFPNCGDL
jgi:hypothetical protein